jgi:SAM-dependent methyltransferase
MKMKADWTTWLHDYKHREIDRTFSRCPPLLFGNGLELGAGDGFQSALLAKYVHCLESTEINKRMLSLKKNPNIKYKTCSAEEAVKNYPQCFFDIVFSSNVLEHVAHPETVLAGVHRSLKDDGITIHIMPSPFWKMCQLLLYIPVNFFVIMERISRRPGILFVVREIRSLLREAASGLTTGTNATLERADQEEALFGNNPGKKIKKHVFLKRLFFPMPHGISDGHWREFVGFGSRHWVRIFKEAGFDCPVILRGPAASGYGLGWTWVERLFEKVGPASEYIYIAQKKGCMSRFMDFLLL